MTLDSPQTGIVGDAPLPAPETPTQARYWVLTFVFTATLLTYLDRVCMSVAAPGISKDLGLSRMQMGYVFGAFDLAYAMFGIPVSWLGDRTGQRKLLVGIVAFWSVLTILTGFAPGLVILMGIRFVFGAAESGSFPTLSRCLARWFPQGERARANGILWMGARLGGSLAPALAVLCITHFGWRTMFFIFGVAGIVWCSVFGQWYRDNPAEHRSVNELELRHIRGGAPAQAAKEPTPPTPWGLILSSPDLWALFAMYFCSAYGFQFFVTWMPTFLMKEHGLSLQRSGLLSAFPLASGTLGCLAGGALSDWLVPAIGSLKWGRRMIGTGSFLVAAVGLGLASRTHHPLMAILLLSLSMGAHDLMLPVAWATCVDIGGRFGGTASSFMNTGSNLSAMIFSVSAAWLSVKFGSFQVVLALASAAYVVGGLLWLRIDPNRKIIA